ncbi:hypothetical protein B4110_1705 [Parageobacillus toebii]|uniref:Uncharacterized protein n=1 Tax=Parageobacillus toebii TaxID=153151 RepID=A0A150MP33_9BACL|nr:hypothetical protein B4110_1705 [Parageobacillus toebii]
MEKVTIGFASFYPVYVFAIIAYHRWNDIVKFGQLIPAFCSTVCTTVAS